MKNIFLPFFAIIIGFSCSKDPIPGPVPLPVKNVTKISSSPNDYQVFEYNSERLITKYIGQWTNGTGAINKITHLMEYNGSQLVKTTNDIGYTFYTYQNNLLSKAENFYLSGKKLSTFLFHYTPQKKLDYVIEQIAFPVAGGAEETKVSYQYNANGNVMRMDFAYRLHTTEPFMLDFSKVFEQYDNHPNPEPTGILGNFIPGIILHINNPVKVNNLNKFGNPTGYSRYEYHYDASGYPIQRKHFIAAGSVENPPVIFQYEY